MSKTLGQLEIYLYKNKLNEKSLIDFLPKFSSNTIKSIVNDLDIDIVKDIKDKLYIYSDGNCRGNGKKHAKGGYSVFFTDNQESPFFKFNKTKMVLSQPTNNKCELSGIRCIFRALHENQLLFKDKECVICTDSKYSIDCINTWSKVWIKNNWLNSKKEPVKNKELIQEILELQKKTSDIKISFKHIFAHTKEPSDKSSIEYKLWLGNKTVDDNINKMFDLSKNE